MERIDTNFSIAKKYLKIVKSYLALQSPLRTYKLSTSLINRNYQFTIRFIIISLNILAIFIIL